MSDVMNIGIIQKDGTITVSEEYKDDKLICYFMKNLETGLKSKEPITIGELMLKSLLEIN